MLSLKKWLYEIMSFLCGTLCFTYQSLNTSVKENIFSVLFILMCLRSEKNYCTVHPVAPWLINIHFFVLLSKEEHS